MSLLPSETLDFGHGQAADADFGQGLADLVQLERFDNGGDLFHCAVLSSIYVGRVACRQRPSTGRGHGRSGRFPEAVRDRIAPIPAERPEG